MEPEDLASLPIDPLVDPKRVAVVESAFEAFLDFGVRRTSMGEIARRAGISPATLYRWFASKDEVILAVLGAAIHAFSARVDRALDRDASAVDQLTDLGVLLVQRLQDTPLMDRVFQTDPELVLPLVTRRAGPALQRMADFVEGHLLRLVADGKLPADPDHRRLAEMLARLGLSLVLTPETAMFRADDPDDQRRIVRRLVEALLPPGP